MEWLAEEARVNICILFTKEMLLELFHGMMMQFILIQIYIQSIKLFLLFLCLWNL